MYYFCVILYKSYIVEMPKPTKLHAKGRSTSIQKLSNAKGEKPSADEIDHEAAVRQFELELCWCIQKLEKTVNDKNGTESEKSCKLPSYIPFFKLLPNENRRRMSKLTSHCLYYIHCL